MSAHAAAPVGLPLARNRTLQVQVALFGLAWLAAAIAPCDRRTWLLENLLVVVGVAVLAASHRRFVFSNLSYSLIFVFLLMHVMGSHYTYSEVPLGAWLRDGLSLGRNHYDRLVHLCFGVLLAYPLRELVLRRLHLHGFGGYLVPVLAILSLSSSYEILESWAARVVDPATGMAFVGAQGDIWDGQKDMSLALAGALLAMLVAAACRRRFDREPYLMWRAHGAASGVPGRG